MSDPEALRLGDRLLVACEGGPCRSRLVHVPAPFEIDETGGTYVLMDAGEPHEWLYLFVPDVH